MEKLPHGFDAIVDRLDRFRPVLLESLRDHQPLIILASLSLVLAAFVRSFSEEAAGFAASAALIFLVALVSSIIVELRLRRDIFLLTTTYVGILVGFTLLLAAAYLILRSLSAGIVAYLIVTFSGVSVISAAAFIAVVAFRLQVKKDDRKPKWLGPIATLLVMTSGIGIAIAIPALVLIVLSGPGNSSSRIYDFYLIGSTLLLVGLILSFTLRWRFLSNRN